jgi:hypothetical protein
LNFVPHQKFDIIRRGFHSVVPSLAIAPKKAFHVLGGPFATCVQIAQQLCILTKVAKARVVLEQTDALYPLGVYLEAGMGALESSQREEIERAILSIGSGDSRTDMWQSRKARLIARLPADLLITKEAKEFRASLQAEEKLPPNRPLFSFESSVEPYTEEKFLRDQGADLGNPENQVLRELYKPLVEWRDKNRPEAQVDELLRVAWSLREILSKTSAADVAVLTTARTHLAAFGSDALRQTNNADSERFRMLRTIVLESASDKEPQPNPKYDSHDHAANERALIEGTRILSVYHTSGGVKFWIITEADRSVTTVLMPEDY